jgi:hypothetical protein
LFNPTIAANPKPVFQEAAEAYLKQSRRDCQIADGYLFVQRQWEFKYRCGIETSSII